MISILNMNLVLLVTGALVALTSANNVPILLEQIDGSIEKIAETVCDGRQNVKHQIGRVSTIKSLATLMNSSKDGSFKSCADEYLDSINKLNDVVSVSNENVCSDQKLTLLENFHRDYISTNKGDLLERESRGLPRKPKIPKLLATFFMQYAVEVGITCRKNLINNLEWDVKRHFEGDEEFAIGSQKSFFDKLFNGVFAKLTPLSSINNFDDIILIWDLIDGSLLASNDPSIMRLEADSQTGELVRLLVKIKSPEQVNVIKEKCRSKMRPFYEKLIIPIARISNLGYSISVQQFERELKELSTSDLVKRWYGVTQFCEAILPIKFYKDESLQKDEIILIDSQEASNLESPVVEMGEVMSYEPTTNSLAHLDELTLVSSLEDQYLVNSVQTKLSARSRAVRRCFMKFARDMKDTISGKLGKIFVSKSDSKEAKADRVDITGALSKSLGDIDEAELEKLEGAGSHRRIKRQKGRSRAGAYYETDTIRSRHLSFMHTASFKEMLDGWLSTIETLAPSRRKIVKWGSLFFFLVFLVTFLFFLAGAPLIG